MNVTVVVPTRDRPEPLRRCLQALSRQAGPGIEIIVVDDGSVDPGATAAVVDAHPGMHLLRRANAGPAAARNAGVLAASGEIVCFTDDDCEPEEEWAERLRAALVAGADAVGGVAESGRPRDPYAEATEEIIHHLRWPERGSRTPRFTPTNNLACRRDLLLTEPFDETFPLASAEDRDWCNRLLERGLKLVVVPDAVVYHSPSTGLPSFWRQHVRYGRGAYRLSRRRGAQAKLKPLSFYGRLVRGGFGRGLRCGFLVLFAQLATAVGFVAEASRPARGT